VSFVVERNPVIIYANLRLNSALTHTGSTGNLRGVWDYDPFGRVSNNLVTSNAVDSDFKFTGHFYHVKSKLHLTLYRAYDADTGRWISRDPIAENGGINLYGYCLNDPVNWVDPLGLWTFGYGLQASGGLAYGGQVSAGIYVGHKSGAGWLSGYSGGILFSGGLGAYFGVGGSVSQLVQVTNANSVTELKGLGYSVGGGIDFGSSFGASYDRCVNIDWDEQTGYKDLNLGAKGLTFSYGVGGGPVPAELH